MNKTPEMTWPELMWSGWMLSAEMSLVIGMRMMRLMAGGRLAEREATRMVTEKMIAGMTLWPALMTGQASQSAEAMTKAALDHFRKPVSANRRRLSRK